MTFVTQELFIWHDDYGEKFGKDREPEPPVWFTYRVPTLLLTKNPGLFQDFPGPHEKFSRTFLEPANV